PYDNYPPDVEPVRRRRSRRPVDPDVDAADFAAATTIPLDDEVTEQIGVEPEEPARPRKAKAKRSAPRTQTPAAEP
ncbi:hypothetical protein G3I15_08370, partial [Streptomyces sp. SID10244]|nr:hypothetical protein [Streptomyces sp. SID10244]